MRQKLGKYIAVSYRSIMRNLNKELEDLDISYGQHEFLYVIMLAENGINQKRLSEILEIGKSTTAKTVKSLEKMGYITRETDTQDKRFKRIFITPKSEAIKERVVEAYEVSNMKMCNNLTDQEVAQLMNLLGKVKSNLDEIISCK